MKKGVFFTLAILVALIALSTFVLLIYKNSLETKERVREAGVLDRIFDIDQSIQNSLRKIFFLRSGISITISPNLTIPDGGGGPQVISIGPSPPLEGIDNRSIEFHEFNLPNPNSASFFTENNDFKDYVEADIPQNPRIVINTTKLNNLPLIVKPYNAIYEHSKGFGGKEINFYPSSVNTIYKYEVLAIPNFVADKVDNITNHSISLCDPPIIGKNGCIGFKFEIGGSGSLPGDETLNSTGLILLNATNRSTFVGFFDITPGNITVTVDNPGQINITNNLGGGINLISKLDIQFNYIYGDQELEKEKIQVFYPELILISLDDLKIRKEGPVRIKGQ